MSNLSLEEGREWWKSLDKQVKDVVLIDVYNKQWSLEEMLRINRLDPHTDKFCQTPYFKVLLEVINVIRKEVRSRQIEENLPRGMK